jgi:hypothetical protein
MRLSLDLPPGFCYMERMVVEMPPTPDEFSPLRAGFFVPHQTDLPALADRG